MGFLDILTGVEGIAGLGSSIFNTINQQKQLDYMKSVQQRTWDREDTAVQRRTKDLEAAGINPLLAAGQSASSSAPIQVGAPQSDLGNQNIAGKMMAIQSAKQNIAQSEADIIRTNEQAQNAKLQNENLGYVNAKEKALKDIQVMNTDAERIDSGYDILARNAINKNKAELSAAKSVADKAALDVKNAQLNMDILLRDYNMSIERKIPYADLGGQASEAANLGNQLKGLNLSSSPSGSQMGNLLSLALKVLPLFLSKGR